MEADSDDGLPDGATLWPAVCRARESHRPDRILNDPYAAHLVAGARSSGLLTETADTDTAFATVLRVVTIDELVQRAIVDHHLHVIVNLGAGLDTRPYRLGLPNDLRWVEIDRDAIFTYKAFRLAHATPACRVERVGVNLSDTARHDAILHRVTRGVARGLLFTEGAPGGLSRMALLALSTLVPAGIKWWLVDPPHQSGPDCPTSLRADREFIDALCVDCWQIAECRPLADEAQRVAPDRLQQVVKGQPSIGDLGAIWLLHRSG
jgi:hypothetical protein